MTGTRASGGLTGILLQGDRRFAIIGEHIVTVGDRWNEYSVVAIDWSYVKLERQGELTVLNLK